MGASTYTWILEQEDLLSHPERWPYPLPVWVFSHRNLPRVPGADLRLVQGDVAPVHAEMVRLAQGKNIWLVGGSSFAALACRQVF